MSKHFSCICSFKNFDFCLFVHFRGQRLLFDCWTYSHTDISCDSHHLLFSGTIHKRNIPRLDATENLYDTQLAPLYDTTVTSASNESEVSALYDTAESVLYDIPAAVSGGNSLTVTQ